MKILVAFSGGKDSLASLIWTVKEFGLNKTEAIFCDTGWEHELTYEHIQDVVAQIGVKLTIVKSKKYDGFVDMAKKKGRFPSSQARFCTEELKTKPMIDFILSQSEHLTIVQGIRKDESNARSKMMATCRFFKFYFEPYGVDKKGKPKFFTYRKEEVIEWCKSYSDDILRPAFNWTAQETINFILDNGFKPNPLYYKGFSRVGCFPCIMCKLQEVKQMAKEFPEYADRLINAETEVGRTFFSPDDIPKRARTGFDPKSGKKLATAKDVIKYVQKDVNQGEIFATDENKDGRCMSFYGLCE
jgi:3'-phosphoadenosine 5'-phosphosulfate sulfotransferase (PAPS reductase)/FAD synthetase